MPEAIIFGCSVLKCGKYGQVESLSGGRYKECCTVLVLSWSSVSTEKLGLF
jgi:hypothetical protein